MAKLFLDTTDTSYKVSNSNTEIFGANGTQAITIDGALTGIVLDANVERVAFSGTTSDYKYKQVGTDLEVYNAAGVLVTKVGLQDDTNGTLLTFANGTVDAKFAPSTTGLGLTVGGQAVATTAPTAVTIPAANIDVVTFPITAPTLSVASVAATATEGTNAIWTVTLANPATTATTVKYTLTNVAGASNADTTDETVTGTGVTTTGSVETAPNSGIWEGTLTFAAGATTATLSLPVALDGLAETGEGVSLSLSNPSTSAIVNEAGKSATVTFVDAPATSFTLTSTGTGVEVQEGSTITFTVTPNSAVNAATTLVLNVQGKALGAVTSTASAADFEASPSITFAQGETAPKTITLKVATDTAVEGREAYSVDVIDTTAYASRGNQLTGVITDKLPTLSLTQNVATVAEGSTVTYTVTSDTPAPTGGIVIPFTVAGTATSGTDYTALTASSITIAAGATTGSVTLSTIADTFTDGADETVIVTLGTAANASVSETAKTVTTSITDSSKALGTAEMTLTGATTVSEGSTVTYTVTLGAAATTALSIPYTLTGTATSGTDFTGSTGTISVAAGSKTGTLTLTTVNDSTTEGAETVTLTLGIVSGFTAASGQGAVTTTINDTSIAVTGTTFTLTTATDALTGTSGNDTFLGTAATTSGTFNAADALNGGDGVDTLNLTVDVLAANSVSGATTTSIENINIRSVSGNAQTIAAGNFSGATAFVSDRSTDAVTITGLIAGQSVGVAGNGAATNGALAVTYANTVTSGTLNVSGGTTAGNVTYTGTGFTSFTVNSTGAANTIGTLALSGTANTALTINAATPLTATGITGFSGTNSTITVSGAATKTSGAVVTLGTIENTTVATINASGLTAGGISATLNTNTAIAVTGGAGNDFIKTGAVLTTGSVAAGAGTGDRLTIAADAHVASLTLGNKYSGFEVVQLAAAATQDLDLLATNNTLTGLRLEGSATVTNINTATAANVTILASATPSLGVKNALTPSQLDTVNLTVSDESATVNTLTITTPVLSGVEVLGITATDHTTITSLASALALTNINVTGAGNTSITTTAIALQTNFNVNAATLTGDLTFNGTGETTNGFSVTGGSGINTITGGSQIFSANLAASTAKADVITVTNATGGTVALPNATLSGFTNSATVAVGDKIDLINTASIGAAVASAATTTVATANAALSATGIFTYSGTGAASLTLADKINIATEAAYGGATQYRTTAFEHNGNTYIVENGDGTAGFIAGTDVVVQLTGVTGVTALSTTASAATTVWVV